MPERKGDTSQDKKIRIPASTIIPNFIEGVFIVGTTKDEDGQYFVFEIKDKEGKFIPHKGPLLPQDPEEIEKFNQKVKEIEEQQMKSG